MQLHEHGNRAIGKQILQGGWSAASELFAAPCGPRYTALMTTLFRTGISSVLLCMGISALSGCTAPQNSAPTLSTEAVVSVESGTVTAQSPEEPSSHEIADGDTVSVGTIISTGADTIASILFADNSTIRLAPSTTIQLASITSESDGLHIDIKQVVGDTWSRVERLLDQEAHYTIETPTTATTVRGTSFNVSVASDGSSSIDAAENDVSVAAVARSKDDRITIEEALLQEGKRLSLRSRDLPVLLSKELNPRSFDAENASRWMALNRAKDRLEDKILERSQSSSSPVKRRSLLPFFVSPPVPPLPPVGLLQQQRQKINIRRSAPDHLNDPELGPLALEVLSLQYPSLAQQLKINIEKPGATDFENSLRTIGAEAAARVLLSREFKDSIGSFRTFMAAPPPPGMISEFLSDKSPDAPEAQMDPSDRSSLRELLESPTYDAKKDFLTPLESFPSFQNKKTRA